MKGRRGVPPRTGRSMSKLGIPVDVDVATIEKELTSFWESAGEAGAPQTMRACACNLICIVQNRAEAEALLPVLAKVSEWHPGRSVIAFPESESVENSAGREMRAWINAQCSVPFSGGPQVCCEVIIIAAQLKAFMELPNMVSALLIEDLPVYIYWKSLEAQDKELLKKIIRFSDLLILDSHQSREDPQNRLQLLQLLVDQLQGISIRDLNWARLTPWRDLISQFFDPPAARHHLHEISEVEIIRNLSCPGSIPTRTLLLTGWLASRLGWRQESARRSGDQWLSIWSADHREIRVNFTGTVVQSGRVPGINSVTLRTQSKAEFSVVVEQGSSSIKAVASAKNFELTHSVSYEEPDEASLLINELTHTSEDAVLKAALQRALELEKSFQGSANPT
jgi:glucose-6-phosphate dehydrogenase assembly protein OpcA